ncbi:MAG TPA: sugar phosphate isomerase/epimerase family protein [Bryobacteraceae bacterium]|nr:sugar phosphate isomerase/epimerase family protein [Bryobacteraceae bacterium]
MAYTFRHAICNEGFNGWDFRKACHTIRNAGYTGIEIAPFTLGEKPAEVSPAQRQEYRSIMEESGLVFVGLHWLMVSPKGLHVTTPDENLRKRSWRHIHDLIDLCADLGPSGVMVFGSPQQRASTGGLTREQATKYYVDGFAEAGPHAQERGVTMLMEALPAGQCDVVQSLDEAAGYVMDVGCPAVQTMFDTHNAVEEVESHAVLVDRHFGVIRHVHVNEMDGRHCGTGDYDFKPVLGVLKQRDYAGWVSLEAFDFAPGPERVAMESLRYLESEIERLPDE